ncbi:B12-binding domain-containing radical SAM protein [Thermoproteota archaeon]
MKKLLLVFPPFCIPTSPPYSLGYLKRFLTGHADIEIQTLDLNLEFHKKITENPFIQDLDIQKYEKISKKFMLGMNKIYIENNKAVRDGFKPKHFTEFTEMILKEKPDFVAFSCFYNQQIFYAIALSQFLYEKGIKTGLGGPAAEHDYANRFDEIINDEFHFLRWLDSLGVEVEKKEDIENPTLNFDFSDLDLEEYYTPETVLPVRSSRGCYHNKCAFCTHSLKTKFYQIPIDQVRKELEESGQHYFQFIDDMISPQRLEQISEAVQDMDFRFSVLTKPHAAFTLEKLKRIHAGGCRVLIWGVESGSQTMLDKMEKGTTVEECELSLKNAHLAGIKNVIYIMLGFPGETKETFMETINFLEQNKDNIDLVSTSVFGLQRESPVFNSPEKYGVTNITEHKRTILMSNFTYEVESGMTNTDAASWKKKYTKFLRKIDKYPHSFTYFRDHFLVYVDKEK